ncbi:hypothetical protein J2S53_003718 [Actinopolyspora lacussalsi]|nr:hypothetical protein [Actinopolyspora lacussalsi]
MLYELEQADVDRVIMEARQEQQNRADRRMLDTLRAQKVLTSAVRMEHVRGRDSPMLAIPDIVCGAVTAEQGGVPDYLQALKPLVTLHTLHTVEGE